MAPLTLAPEDDDSRFSFGLDSGLAVRKHADESTPPTAVQKLHGRFDPTKVGFGLLAPWPGTENAVRSKDYLPLASLLETQVRNDQSPDDNKGIDHKEQK